MRVGVSTRMAWAVLLEFALFAGAGWTCRHDPLALGLILGGLAMAMILSVLISRNLALGARQMATAARGLARGEVDQQVTLRTDDDLGRIADAFREMIDYQHAMARTADAMARGELDAEIEPRSEHDVLGVSFQRMRASLRELIDALEHQALYDSLTDLPNRALLNDRMTQALAGARRGNGQAALLLLDLDHFKEVNDTFGHHYGDLMLRGVSERLGGVLREGDTFARLGGDEFAVVLPGAGEDEAGAIALRMLAELRLPVALDDQLVASGASIGIALFPEHGMDPETLLRRADVAMYLAKETHNGHVVYAPERDRHSSQRLALAGELRGAAERGELVVFYQPKLDYAAREIACVEALVRWRHPTRGLVPPNDFIPLAEQTGLIGEITEWVLGTALAQAATWRRQALDIAVAVNLSARTLHDPTLPDLVAGLLHAHGLGPRCLVLEITESALMTDPELSLEVVKQLHRQGVAIAIDDFGTGYSSLAYLERLPAGELKIDRSFVQRMGVDENNRAIVRSTISLAHELGLRVVAEGVEDAATLHLLAVLGCDLAQGFYLSRPVPAAALTAWLLDSPWAPRIGTDRPAVSGRPRGLQAPPASSGSPAT